MTGAPFSHIGGAVISDHGPIALAGARALIAFYRREARLAARDGAAGWAGRCESRAVALRGAHEAATRWRRATGWGDPEAADGCRPLRATDRPIGAAGHYRARANPFQMDSSERGNFAPQSKV